MFPNFLFCVYNLALSYIDKLQGFQWALIAPLVADLFLFRYERNITLSLSDDIQADIIDAFNTTCTSRYLDDNLNLKKK